MADFIDPSVSAAAIAAAALGRVDLPVSPLGTGMSWEWSDAVLRYLMSTRGHHAFERDIVGEATRAILSGGDPYRPKSYEWALPHREPHVNPASEAALSQINLLYGLANQRTDFSLLEAHRSDVASLARFSQRVDHATFYLFVAVDGFVERLPRKSGSTARRSKGWYGNLAHQCFTRWKSARELLVQDWPLPEESEPLYRTAFWGLCELTPADSQLKELFEQDRFRASCELVRHVDVYAEQLALAAELADTLARAGDDLAPEDAASGLEAVQEALLDKAGERLSLTQAADRLGITRQALHKKIKTGSALGLMIGETFVLPAIQLIKTKGGTAIVPHLREVLSLFEDAGSWSSLQYLIEPDPALGGAVPLERLKAGEHQLVVAGARAYLGLDEG